MNKNFKLVGLVTAIFIGGLTIFVAKKGRA
jgi:hypothetical protein